MTPRQKILLPVEIPWAEAVWVLTAHLYATLVPLALSVAVYYHWDYLVATTYNPFLLYIAVGLMCAGSAFEVAQNTIDNWYLTSDVGSANGVGLCDFLFYWLITAAQALCAIAIGGGSWWVTLVAVSAVLIFPICYFRQVAHFAPLLVVNLLVVFLVHSAFGDPIIFLQILLTGVTLYFFAVLQRTGAQVIHGFTTLAASSGIWLFVWALKNGAAGTPSSWESLALICAAVIGAGLSLWPMLMKLPTSARVIRNQGLSAPLSGPAAGNILKQRGSEA